MTGEFKLIDGQWRIYHCCGRCPIDENCEPSLYPIDKDSKDYFSTLTMFGNPEGKPVDFKVIHRDSKGELITDYHAVPIEQWTWEAVIIPPEEIKWQTELKKVKQCPQRQDSLTEQLHDLKTIAARFGFYDAADYLKTT